VAARRSCVAQGSGCRVSPLYQDLAGDFHCPWHPFGHCGDGHSVDDVTADMLQDMSQWCLREDTLKAANALLVNFHHRIPSVRSGGMARSPPRMANALVASQFAAGLALSALLWVLRSGPDGVSPCGGPAQRLAYPVIACAVREAISVLDGLLNNDTVLRPRNILWTNMGVPIHCLALSSLRVSLMPRLNVTKQLLYKLDRTRPLVTSTRSSVGRWLPRSFVHSGINSCD